ncbi:hypothetical protein AAG570_012874 [Ranatra chinensis]|uniref:Uncharacterized protein n=1 Tax=Ranatra chinensis TaxID=642074 RepID=A0ABD0YF41_9HEMI
MHPGDSMPFSGSEDEDDEDTGSSTAGVLKQPLVQASGLHPGPGPHHPESNNNSLPTPNLAHPHQTDTKPPQDDSEDQGHSSTKGWQIARTYFRRLLLLVLVEQVSALGRHLQPERSLLCLSTEFFKNKKQETTEIVGWGSGVGEKRTCSNKPGHLKSFRVEWEKGDRCFLATVAKLTTLPTFRSLFNKMAVDRIDATDPA